ncbi:MAG: hypothetical protein AMJ78_04655 [Omnitrophica WOR_2 bacterium SM23_29]|nr:MAG: hypothetical protein AMJ78_04655 [Omnitrophica WOR_2 bacterium SM23_29]
MFRKIVAIAAVLTLLVCSSDTVSLAKGKPQPPQPATLEQTLELRQIDSANVPFQHNRPYSSFEKQNNRTYLDLAGTWKYLKIVQSDTEINTTLSRRDGSAISQLESSGYHTLNFNDNGWANQDLPICENQIGSLKEEKVYWFRRHFTVPIALQDKYVELKLLGANYVTDVWVNGKYIRWHEGGYTSFAFDVSKCLNYGADNVIAVRVHNIPWDNRNTTKDIVPYKTLDFRNYGGIFRNIYLEAKEPLHLVRTDIKPSLKFSGGQPLENDGHVDVNVVLYNAGATTQTADVDLSVYGTIVDESNILDPKPEAILNVLNPITISGISSNSVDVGVTDSVYQDFEPDNGTPGDYFEDIWQSSPAFETTIVHSGTTSLKIATGDGGGTVGILAASPSGYLDLSTATSLSVWVYDTQGSNTIQLRLRDADGDGGNGEDGNYLWSDATSVQNQWTKITFDLNRYPDAANLDLDRISKIELYEWYEGVYYFDDVEYTINETKVLTFSLDLYGISLWTPVNPALFVLKADLNSGGELFYTQFGIRQVEVDNDNCRFLLNKVPTFLAGVARHESMPNVFRKFTESEMAALKTDFQNVKDANMNFIRTAHYANHPNAYILADRMGIMIWEELVATWFDAEAFDLQRLTREVAKQMWLEMIYRDYNRPSIIIWATNNEGTVGAETQKQAFNEDLHNVADSIDGTRLVAQAIVGSNDTDSSLASDDILGINEYWGVFYGTAGDYYGQTKASIKRTNNAYQNKPILVSEMGTWSNEDLSRMAEQVNCWNDTYQAFDEKPYIAGVTWWCINDWWQAPGTAQTMGAITWDRATKKDVYYSIQADYANTWTQPVVKLLSISDDATLSGDVTITAYAEDFRGTSVGIDTVQYKIDSDEYNNMTSQGDNQYSAIWDSTTASNGAHTLTVKSTDYDSHERIHLVDVMVNNGSGGGVMHIQSIDMSIVVRGPNVNAKADVLVVDSNNQAVEGALVYGQWSGLTSDSDQVLTDLTGHAIANSDKLRNPVGTFTFTVTDITKDGWTYDPESNVETSDSISYP